MRSLLKDCALSIGLVFSNRTQRDRCLSYLNYIEP